VYEALVGQQDSGIYVDPSPNCLIRRSSLGRSLSRNRWESLQESTPAYLARKWEWESWESNPAIAKTYSVKRRALALLLSKDSEVTLSIDAQTDRVGRVEASAGWWQSHVGGAWNTHTDVSQIFPDVAYNEVL